MESVTERVFFFTFSISLVYTLLMLIQKKKKNLVSVGLAVCSTSPEVIPRGVQPTTGLNHGTG